jgi:opacity protein-like surface antigen
MKRLFYITCLILFLFASALAQETPKAEVFGGYSWAGGNFHGWDTSVTGNVNKWFGLTANFSGHYGSEQNGIVLEKEQAHSFLFGPRFAIRKSKRVTPFVYALFGGVRFKDRLTISLPSGPLSVSVSDTGFNMALGGGLDVRVNDHLAIRAFQIDYLRPNFFGEAHNRGRLAFGVVFRFGKK